MQYQQVLNPTTNQLANNTVLKIYDVVINKQSHVMVECVPNDQQNSDWKEYQAWLSEGNTPLAPLPVVVPTPASIKS